MWRGAQNSIRPKTAGTYRVIVVVFLPIKIGEIIFFWKGWFNQREWIVLVESGSLAIGREQKAKPGGKTSLEPLPHCTLAKTNIALAGGLPKRELIFWPQCFSCYASFSEGCIVGYFSFWCDTFRTVKSYFLMLWLGVLSKSMKKTEQRRHVLFDKICWWVVFFQKSSPPALPRAHGRAMEMSQRTILPHFPLGHPAVCRVSLLVGPVMHWVFFSCPTIVLTQKQQYSTKNHMRQSSTYPSIIVH